MTVQISWYLCNPCPACNEWVGELVSNLAKRNLVECQRCGHVFKFSSRPAGEAIASVGHLPSHKHGVDV